MANETQEMKEAIMSIFPATGEKGLDIEEIIRRVEFKIEYPTLDIVGKALNELVWEKRLWISVRVFTGKYISYKNFFSLCKK